MPPDNPRLRQPGSSGIHQPKPPAQSRKSLRLGQSVGISAGAGDAIKKGDFVVVTLDGVDIRRLLSSDHLTERGGTLAFDLNGQGRSLGWAFDRNGQLRDAAQYSRQMLFFGRSNDLIGIDVRLTESDQDIVGKLTDTQALVAFAAAMAAMAPGYGTAASAGLNTAGAMLDFARARIDDDLELAFLGSIGSLGAADDGFVPIRAAKYEIARGSDVVVVLRLHKFDTPSLPTDTQVAVVLDSITADLDGDLDDHTLAIELTFGGGKDARKLSFSEKISNGRVSVDQVVGLRNRPVYVGPWDVGVPFSISAAALNKTNLAKLDGVIKEGSSIAGAFVDGDEDAKKRREQATAAAQSLRALIIELLPDKTPLGSMSGMIAATSYLAPELRNLDNFKPVSNLDAWSPVAFELRVGTNRLNVALKVKKV